MKYFIAFVLAVFAQTAFAQTAFTYGDMLGNEVRVEESDDLLAIAVDRLRERFAVTDDDHLVFDRLQAQPANILSQVAATAQVAGDGITCDILVPFLLLQEGAPFIDAAYMAQDTCLLWAIAAVQAPAAE